MQGTEDAVAELMTKQYGLVTRQQAHEAGMSSNAIDRRLSSDKWIRQEPGVYRHAAVRPSWESQLLAACLRTGGFASHLSAAYLWELDGVRRPRPSVVVSSRSPKIHDVVAIYPSTQFDQAPFVYIRRIPVTSIERTLIDLAAVVRWEQFEAAIDDALRRNLVTWKTLILAYRRWGRKGRNGSAFMRRLLKERSGDESVPLSVFSRRVADLLVANGLPVPVFEYRVRHGGSRRFAQVDLGYPDERVAIELQSVRCHLDRKSFESDARRATELAAAGWTWIPVTWEMFVDEPNALVRAIKAALHRAAA